MGKKATCMIILAGAIILSIFEAFLSMQREYVYSGSLGSYGYYGTYVNSTLWALFLVITWAIAIGAIAYVANKQTFTGGMKYCEKCGKKNPMEAKLCRHCGKEF